MAGSDRKAISFTMTLVVTGLVLVATAAIVMTFSSSGITDFFNTIGGQQESNVEEFKVQQACSELKEEINTNYCDRYMPAYRTDVTSADYTGCSVGGSWNFCSEAHYFDNGGNNYGPSATFWVVDSQNCAPSTSDTSTSRSLPSLEIANDSSTDQLSDEVFIETGTQLSCSWREGGFDPNVEVEGQTFNCLEENYIQSDACPVQ
jgi:hypothetical protein